MAEPQQTAARHADEREHFRAELLVVNARIKEPEPDQSSSPPIEDWRRLELRAKHWADPASKDWQDTMADDAGIPRYGEI